MRPCVFAALLVPSLCPGTTIEPCDPPAPAIVVDGIRLPVDPPETARVEVRGAAPRNRDQRDDAWQPWPGKHPEIVRLSPERDSEGTPILGHLFRSIRPESVRVTDESGRVFVMDEDFAFDPHWGTIANLNGRLGAPGSGLLIATAEYALQRIDLVQRGPDGGISIKRGTSAAVCPALPDADLGHVPLAGIYVAPWRAHEGVRSAQDYPTDCAVTAEDIFPIRPAPPVRPIRPESVSRTRAKLQAGESVTVAFVGDSVMVGAESPRWFDESIKFTERDLALRGRFVAGLRRRFPGATLVPIEASQGGKTTKYGIEILEDRVIPAAPDLLVVFFGANDVDGPVGGPPKNSMKDFEADMAALFRRAREAGIEVLAFTPMQLNPWLSNRAAQRQPAYREALLRAAEVESVAVADGYSEWLNLATRGIPPFSQLHNWKNHPGAFGHGVLADVALRFFESETP